MSKIFKIFSILIAIFSLNFIFMSCEDTTYKPSCEEYHKCSVNVHNHTGYSLYVDVNDIDVLYISNGGTGYYTNVASGQVTIWASFNATNWTYWNRSVSDCGTLDFEITYSKSGIVVTENGVEIETQQMCK